MEQYDDSVDLYEPWEDDEDTLKDRYLAFIIDNEDYAIEITDIIEIIGIQKITFVPNIKPYIKGIINLRGNIIPVVDVRKRFEIGTVEYDEKTCIIVVNIKNTSIGLIVDEVLEVIDIPEENISPSPKTNKGTQSKFIKGIGRYANTVKIILNTNILLYDDIEKNEEDESINN